MPVLKQLRLQLTQVDEVIHMLERMQSGAGRRRGRPPAWLGRAEKPQIVSVHRSRKPFSKETRLKMAESQRRRWAKRKSAAS
jgi:hypothetical protein